MTQKRSPRELALSGHGICTNCRLEFKVQMLTTVQVRFIRNKEQLRSRNIARLCPPCLEADATFSKEPGYVTKDESE